MKHTLRVLLTPEDAVAFEAQIDDSSDRAFDGSTSAGNPPGVKLSIAHTLTVIIEVVALASELFRLSADTEFIDSSNDKVHLTRFQTPAVTLEPPFTFTLYPARAKVCGGSEVLEGVVIVDDLGALL